MYKDKSEFIFPRASYRGDWSPEEVIFNANLQEFSQRVGIICSLQTNGKITAEAAYLQINSLWQDLQRSKKSLHIQAEK